YASGLVSAFVFAKTGLKVFRSYQLISPELSRQSVYERIEQRRTKLAMVSDHIQRDVKHVARQEPDQERRAENESQNKHHRKQFIRVKNHRQAQQLSWTQKVG